MPLLPDDSLTRMSSKIFMSFFFQLKQIKVFEENIPRFFHLKWTSIGVNRLKVQIALSMQLQMGLHYPRQTWILDDMGLSELSEFFYSGSDLISHVAHYVPECFCCSVIHQVLRPIPQLSSVLKGLSRTSFWQLLRKKSEI